MHLLTLLYTGLYVGVTIATFWSYCRLLSHERWIPRVLCAGCLHFITIALASVLVHLLIGSIAVEWVATMTGIAGLVAIGVRQRSGQTSAERDTRPFAQMDMIVLLVLVPFLFASSFNAIRLYNASQSIPIVGGNDDHAVHLAMAVVAVKENDLLPHSPLIAAMAREVSPEATGMQGYPPAWYANMSYYYHLFRPTHDPSLPIDLPLLLNIYAVMAGISLLALLAIIYYLGFLLYVPRSWASAPIYVVVGWIFITGVYLISLYRRGFYTQIAGYVVVGVLMYLLLKQYLQRQVPSSKFQVPNKSQNPISNLYNFITLQLYNRQSCSLQLEAPLGHRMDLYAVCICLVGIGLTYYLFLPISLLAVVVAVGTRIYRGWREIAAVSVSWLVSCLPLVYFSLSYDLQNQITIPGIPFFRLEMIILVLGLFVLFLFLRRYFASAQVSFFLYMMGLTLAQAVFVLVHRLTATSIVPYYFFKMYFSIFFFALPPILGLIGLCTDMIEVKIRHLSVVASRVYTVTILSICVLIVYQVSRLGLTQHEYQWVIPLQSGYFNYFSPRGQREYIDLYRMYGNDKKNTVSIGFPGELYLVAALFGDIDEVNKSAWKEYKFQFTKSPGYYYENLVVRIMDGEDIAILDGHDSFHLGLPDYLQKVEKVSGRKVRKDTPLDKYMWKEKLD